LFFVSSSVSPTINFQIVPSDIAETSITIEDVVFVVDTGRVKENRRDEVNGMPTLEDCWVSRASAKQRRGRAGRVRPGIAYHLFSSHTHDSELQDYQLPEMLRVGIEELVLQILILDLGEPTVFLKKAMDPPSNLAMSNSLKMLEQLGAVGCEWRVGRNVSLDEPKPQDDESTANLILEVSSELTALGFHLATLPVDPRVGKLLIYSCMFGCVNPILTLAASMSTRSPFVSPFDQRQQADEARRKFSAKTSSDHLTILNAFNDWSNLRQSKGNNRVVQSFLKDNYLGRIPLLQMEDLRKQFRSLLVDIGFLPQDFSLNDMKHPANANAENVGLLKAVLCAGLYPNILVAPKSVVSNNPNDKKLSEVPFHSHTKGVVYLHPSTIASNESRLDSRYCCYHELVRTSKTYVRDSTTVSPLALLLFGGALKVYQIHGVCSIDGWLKFRIDAKPATLIKYLRSKMEGLLCEKIVSPEKDVMATDEGKSLIAAISQLFESESSTASSQHRSDGGEILRPWTGYHDEIGRFGNIHQRKNRGGRSVSGRGRERGHSGGGGGRDD
jgi:HrpA-like RNA helicase